MRALKQPATVLLLALIVLTVIADQLTKWMATHWLVYARPVEVLPVLNWTLLHNTGAAFSFLSDAGGWQRWLFTVISVVVSLVFLVWMYRTPAAQGLMRYSLALIVGGALGNLIDRIQLGYVVDFISVHWQSQYFFPAFNIADSAITIGAILMILDILLHPEAHK